MDSQRPCTCEPGCAISYGACHCGCGAETTIAPQNSTRMGWTRGEPIKYVRGHAGRKAIHSLTGIDEQARTATCATCGPVSVKANGTDVAGRTQWRCLRRVSTEHYLTGIDELARSAFCRGCGNTVPITKNPSRTKGWVCSVKLRESQVAYKKAHPGKIKDGHKAWRDANPGRIRDYQLQRLYGISLEEYNAEVARREGRREGRCDICGEVPNENGTNGQSLCVEHNHSTGEVRGYADRDCNTMIGGAKDDPVRLAQGIIYLKPSPEQLAEIIRRLEWFRDVSNFIAASK